MVAGTVRPGPLVVTFGEPQRTPPPRGGAPADVLSTGHRRSRRWGRPGRGAAVVGLMLLAGGLGWALHPRVSVTPRAAPGDSAEIVAVPRPAGTPVLTPPVKDGNLLLRPLAASCGQSAVFGTHAELEPTGSYCQVDVEVVNGSGEAHELDTREQQLVLADGRRLRPDPSAMGVRRQPDVQPLAGRQRLWLELWFDVPTGGSATAVALRGDKDPPAFRASAPAERAPDGVMFPLHGP